MKTRLLLSVALLAAARLGAQTAPAAAAAAPAPAPAAVTPVATPATPAPAPGFVVTPDVAKAGITKSQDTVSTIDFPDEDIRTILRNVADLFEINVVIPDTLQGKTSIKLRDVTWRDIYKVVLSPVGYTFIEDGSIIKVVSQEALAQEPLAKEVFVLNYADATTLVDTIKKLQDAKDPSPIVDKRTNSIVVSAPPSEMRRIRELIGQLDKATDQVMIESKFIEVDSNDIKNIGVNWSSLSGYGLSAGPAGINYNKTTGVTGSNGNNNSTTTNTNNGTTSGNTTANGNSSSSTFTAGVGPPTNSLTNNNTSSTTATTAAALGNTVTAALTNLNTLANPIDKAETTTAVFSAAQFNVVISALQSLNGTKIVSNPTIVTLNNQEAVINVGEEDPIPDYQFNAQTGTYQVTGFKFKPIGVILTVTPRVNARGFIQLTLAPEVSQKTGSINFSGTDIPIIGTNKATTNVSLKDGYTMGIGGLMSKNANKSTTKVPLLGDMPIIGYLFKSSGKNETMKNLIIFITAKTINPDGAPIEQMFNSADVRSMEIQREDLPGFRDGTDPFKPLPVVPPVKPAPAAVKPAPAAAKP